MTFRIATLNLEQDYKRWPERQELVIQQLGEIRPDIFALNEVCIPQQTGRWLQRTARNRLRLTYTLIQQSKTNNLSTVETEAILTRYPVVETATLITGLKTWWRKWPTWILTVSSSMCM